MKGGKLIDKHNLSISDKIYNLCINNQNWNGAAKIEREKNTQKTIIEYNQNKSGIVSTIKTIPLVLWLSGLFK